MDLSQSISTFFCHISAQQFHPETIDSDAPPVQILGGLEASGQIFDYCWFVGMSEKIGHQA